MIFALTLLLSVTLRTAYCREDACASSWFNDPKINETDRNQRDEIFSLLAFAVVNSDWQPSPEEARKVPELARKIRRGHNIGTVLVDPQGLPVWWARNHNYVECNNMNHGETRAIYSYLNFRRSGSLTCYSLYSTLEPCAMCAGTMALQNISRTVFSQEDPDFGGALERLQAGLPSKGTSCAYPQTPHFMVARGSRYSLQLNQLNHDLEAAYRKFMKTRTGALIDFLVSPSAHSIFELAQQRFLSMGPEIRPANMEAYKVAVQLFKNEISQIDFPISLDQHVELAKLEANGAKLDKAYFQRLKEQYEHGKKCDGLELSSPLRRTTGNGSTTGSLGRPGRD